MAVEQIRPDIIPDAISSQVYIAYVMDISVYLCRLKCRVERGKVTTCLIYSVFYIFSYITNCSKVRVNRDIRIYNYPTN